ncbi:diphthine methyltransferase [Chrysoperla carnea]|uniref:diphthine methyltransferase n=1 Tax=Chrysoperla carnea TaxID=189513 RepID=UPI001D063076|nr:diphthine methyltransferase [Chrysoperla carnea]
MTSKKWIKIFTDDTEYSADSVEWCPHEPNQNLFVCGTYQLQENNTETPQTRIGRLYLYSISIDKNTLKCLQRIDTAAILDIKWCHNQINSKSILAAANALGQLLIFELQPTYTLKLITNFQIPNSDPGKDLLSLSIDWSTGKYENSNPEIVVSDSTGYITILKYENEQLNLKFNWKAHDFEAWICAFDYWNSNLIYTGGDDCKLKMFDIRNLMNPILVKSNHEAGVTSLQFNTKFEHIFVSGSYDENILIWDNRSMKRPLSTIKTSGGVWRLKWDPFSFNKILAACMYGSFHILNVDDHSNPEIIANYCEHASICYGADWCYIQDDSKQKYIGTCSFYDHLLNVSKIYFE